MHIVMFGMNRAFHKVMEVGRELTLDFGLTPSRFNLLNALLIEGGSLRQVFLQRMLGVTAPNVSRMVTSLEALGFVVRRRDAFGRCCAVELTPLGRERIERAVDWLVLKGNAHKAVLAFFPPRTRTPRHPPSPHAHATSLRLDARHFALHLETIRKSLHDRALLRYSWLTPTKQPNRAANALHSPGHAPG
jgi:DNA-binding MarR family transcriptional regulator